MIIAPCRDTRGLTELIILTVGLQLGVLSGQLYSFMVVMALVTTAMTGPLLKRLYPLPAIEAPTESQSPEEWGTTTSTFRVRGP